MMNDAVPLVLLPGLMCDGRIFEALLEAFPTAIAIPGYGLDDNFDAMTARVLAQAPEKFALLGHSMGARIALEVMRAAPSRVQRLALVSTGTHGVRPGEADKRYALRELGRAHGIEALVDAWLPPMIAPANLLNAPLVAALRQMCVDAGLATFEAQIAALLARPEVESMLPNIAVPTLVAVGSEDIWSPPQQHRELARAIPNAVLRVCSGAGHMLPAEDPCALNEAVAQWLLTPG